MKKTSIVVVKINMTTISKHFILFVHYCTFIEDVFVLVWCCEICYGVFFCKSRLCVLSNVSILQYLNAYTLKKERNAISS